MIRSLVTLLLAAALLVGTAPVNGQAHDAPGAPEALDLRVEALRASLTSEERVGQLMLVTFDGMYVGPDSPVTQLIRDYNIGGVVLLAENDNINGQSNTPQRVKALSAALQQAAFDAADATEGQATSRSFVPLFVATTHAGNGQPHTQIALGTTPLPSLMALGATWQPELAQAVGQVAGAELSAMGINMLLGPALDVHQQPQIEHALDLGVNTFGGEPHWVGRMAQAYIRGVHEGSNNRIAVIAQHFPGLGLADTSPDESTPVIPRGLNELAAFDLLPYHAVTGLAGTTPARADGIQCANVRYQGETVRTVTGPVCLDEAALDDLLRLDAFRDWRQRGLVISSALGSPGVRRHYGIDPFPHRQTAREAFLAGNDMLYLADFATEPGGDQLANVIDVIKFFADRYENDPVFRVRVDQSLTRILRLKLTLYDGDLSLENVQQAALEIDAVGGATATVHTIAQAATTLVAPRREALPAPPSREDDIVIFTDVRLVQQCSYCATYPLVPVNALEAAIERMYGPRADAQIDSEQVVSFSFSQLEAYLSGGLAGQSQESSAFRTSQQIGEALRGANWVVFVLVNTEDGGDASGVLLDFMQHDPVAARVRTAVIALGAPGSLSATEISRFSAYYALYSSVPPFIDAAARALFQESTYTGALPVSVPAAGYDIFRATSPRPEQTIQVVLESIADRPISNASARETITARPGDRLALRTEPILDRNGNRVPDDTPVEFLLTFTQDNLQTSQQSTTLDGVASTSFTPSRTGRVQITAAAGPATRSNALQIVIAGEDAVAQGAAPPTEAPTAEPAPTGTGTMVAAAPPESADAAQGAAASPAEAETTVMVVEANRRVSMFDLVVSLFGLALMGTLGFAAGLSTTLSVNGGLRVVLGSVVSGLIGYIYYSIGGPGSGEIRALLTDLAPMITTLAASLVGMLYTWWTVRGAGRRRR